MDIFNAGNVSVVEALFQKGLFMINLKRKEQVKEILAQLLKKKSIGYYTRNDIDRAIIEVRGVDKRTLDNWFSVLFRLGYIEQKEPNVFHLVLEKVTELELSPPIQFDSKQQRLV